MCARWERGLHRIGVLTLIGIAAPIAAPAAEVPPAPPVLSAQVRIPCRSAAELAPRHSAVHIGNFDVHLSMGVGAGEPLHVGLRLNLMQPLRHSANRPEIPSLRARGTSCGAGSQRGLGASLETSNF